MTRMTTTSTAIGLVGLAMAMLAALSSSASPVFLALGFTMMILGLFGAVFGAAASLVRT